MKEKNKKTTKRVAKSKEKAENKILAFFNKKTDFKIYELLLFAFLIVIVSVILTYAIISATNSCKKVDNKPSGELAEFEEVYNLIKTSYFKKVNKTKLIDGAINGMLESLGDPHTSYFNKAETENFNEVMTGSYEGIGAEISVDKDGNIIVFSVFKNSPAAEVGLKFNDIIISVNDEDTTGMTTTEVVSIIKDPNKKDAKVVVMRDGEKLEFNITKRIVEIESVESKIYKKSDKKIGYVLINNFAGNTYSQFKMQVEKLETENISGLIIDVRGNSGGYLTTVTDMLDMFLPKDQVLYQIADKKVTTKYTAQSQESRNYPIAVLVNKGSASASEILAIGLKEEYGASVVGTFTYGKGTVQVTKNLTSGAMIKYTIQKWLSPKGNWINDVGVEPTDKVELSSDYEKNPIEENDNQLQKALEIIYKK